MRSRALTGTTEGTFDTLLVRSPADTGAYQNILSLIDTASSSPTYDDTALQTAIAANATSISNLSTTTTAALAGKVSNSQVLTDVPAGAVFTDTVYTHPVNHPISTGEYCVHEHRSSALACSCWYTPPGTQFGLPVLFPLDFQ